MDVLSGSINKTEAMYPMPKIVLVVDDVRSSGELWERTKGEEGKTTWMAGPDKFEGGDL